MIKCACGGYIAELGELEDYNNPCKCKDLKIIEMEKENQELEKQLKEKDAMIELLKNIIKNKNKEKF